MKGVIQFLVSHQHLRELFYEKYFVVPRSHKTFTEVENALFAYGPRKELGKSQKLW